MPEENKIKKDDPQVDIDTSGPDVDVNLPEEKKEETGGIADIQVEEKTTEQETDKTFENERETKLEEGGEVEKKEETKDDDKLEEYSKGVQSRIAKLTRKCEKQSEEKKLL